MGLTWFGFLLCGQYVGRIAMCQRSWWVTRACSSQGDHRPLNTLEAERQLLPRVAVVCRVPHVAIAQAGIQMPWRVRVRQQRIGHVVERLWQPAAELLPPTRSDLAENIGAGLAINV